MPVSELCPRDLKHIFVVEGLPFGVMRVSADESGVHEPPILGVETTPESRIAFFISDFAVLEEGLAQDKETLVVGAYIFLVCHARSRCELGELSEPLLRVTAHY
jgi:hypothetical protein